MTNDNICKFISKSEQSSEINIINFVRETKKQEYVGFKCESVYKMHIAFSGRARLNLLEKSYDIEEGDVFFTFPGISYAIESYDAFRYMYISFLGVRANEIMDKLNITRSNLLFKNMQELLPIWKTSIVDDKSIIGLKCEGILLYSFSLLGEKEKNKVKEPNNTILLIKKYIDENFSDKSLSVEVLSKKFSYNPKYISQSFKKTFKIGISQYIKILRIQKACMLIEHGFTSIKDIAFQCGYADQFYFSRVFKDEMGMSPKAHILLTEHSTNMSDA